VAAAVFDRAIEHVLGRRPRERVRMSGKTDPQIVGEYLDMLGLRPDHGTQRGPDAWPPDATTAAILDRIAVELAAATDELAHGRALPGAVAALERLVGRPDVAQSVLTGNVVANAEVKLRAFSLLEHLDLTIGAFGSDHVDRQALVPVALRRAAARFGAPIPPARVCLIGDTPNDLRAARAHGARCVLVATGRYDLRTLAHLGPDAVLADLTDTDAVVAAILSATEPAA
jgi:phosphoglycolate phosphatase